jgi:X-X-X-Leu-X-X-Gly heptad repeat protein
MPKFKALCLVAAMILCLCLAGGAAQAADKVAVLKAGAEKLEAVFGGNEIKAVLQGVSLFKQAGLSYQPSLVTPLKGVAACKDTKQLGSLMGLYGFDSNYALLFGKKKEFLATHRFMYTEIADRLKITGKVKIQAFTPEDLKKLAANPDDPANRELFIKYQIANLHAYTQLAQTDAQFASIMVDLSYGAVIEGMYVACKLGLSAKGGDKLVALFNEQAKRLDKMRQVLEVYAEDQDLAEMLDSAKRQAVLKPVLELLKARSGKLTEDDVRRLLGLVAPERAAMVKPCI